MRALIFFLATGAFAAAAQETGTAVYYADSLHGRTVASGGKYDKRALTAAHRSHPFGTLLRVTNVSNGKSVEVQVNDRMPKSANRIVDLSRAAAEQIGLVQKGRATVRVQVIRKGTGKVSASKRPRREIKTRRGDPVAEKPSAFGN